MKEIDRIFGKKRVRERFSSKVYFQACKSHCKKDMLVIRQVVFHCSDLKQFKEMLKCLVAFFFKRKNLYVYRNEEYTLKMLIEPFIFEYLRDLFGFDKRY